MMCVGCYEIEPPTYKRSIKKIIGIRTNGMLENELMCFY